LSGATCLAVIGGLALITGHLSKIVIETGLIAATIVFVFCAWILWTIGWIKDGH
jgi:type IV secretory pathway TrbD component